MIRAVRPRALHCAVLVAVGLASVAAASPLDPPARVRLYAPRAQEQKAGLLAVTCVSETSGGVADSFQIGWPPVKVRKGSALKLRIQRADPPSEVRVHGPRHLLPFTLEAYEPDGVLESWDVRFRAPGPPPRRAIQERNGERYHVVVLEATWEADGECSVYRRGEWGLSLSGTS
ncbi:MAG: hypothetical protein ACRDH9_05240 [Actinomycetota bacterium]